MYNVIPPEPNCCSLSAYSKPIYAWNEGVPFEEEAVKQLRSCARLPFIFSHIAAMPDCHAGWGSTVGSVIPVFRAVVPSAVGVDIGCGMIATKLELTRAEVGDLPELRRAIENAVPHGRTDHGGERDRGSWHNVPEDLQAVWTDRFADRYDELCGKHPGMRAFSTFRHLGTLGTGNHFIELSEDESGWVWIVLHSGSRGLGNKIGSYFSALAKGLCEKWFIELPDPDLAFIPESEPAGEDYSDALYLAQEFAEANRAAMAAAVLETVRKKCSGAFGKINVAEIVSCHHNYAARENHFGSNITVIRKGAVRARAGDRGIIPGSMGARTYIVEGLGNPNSFHSCSHGAGRAMSRTKAEATFSLEDHAQATAGVECDKSAGVLDETPGAYKDIEAVMAAQADLVRPVARLKQFLCVKGIGDKQRGRRNGKA